MKKTNLLFFLLLPAALVVTSCGNKAESVESAAQDTATSDEATANNATTASSSSLTDKLYVGMFEASNAPAAKKNYYKNKISISIDSIGGGKVKGHSVVAGNDRPFRGTYEEKKGVYVVKAAEPGDDKYDGRFSFSLDTTSHILEGSWEANNKKLEVNKRVYRLEQKIFTYDPTRKLDNMSGTWINAWSEAKQLEEEDSGSPEALTEQAFEKNASVDKLTKTDVENMYKGDLEVMRNAIYARHGYSFKNKRMRYIFDTSVDWYIPVTTDVRNELTDIEKENIALIKRYEEHAGKYYDSYGR